MTSCHLTGRKCRWITFCWWSRQHPSIQHWLQPGLPMGPTTELVCHPFVRGWFFTFSENSVLHFHKCTSKSLEQLLCLLGIQVSHWLRVRPTRWQISLSQAHDGPCQLLLFHRFPYPQAGPHGHPLPNCWRDLLFTPTLPCQECRFCPISPSNICIILVVILLSCKTRIRPTPSDSVMNRLFTRYLHDRIFFCLSFRWSVRATHAGDIERFIQTSLLTWNSSMHCHQRTTR